MPEIISADGARVLADLNALRAIGTYKTGVHKPTFSQAHMRSLEWLAARLPEAGLSATIDGIGNVLGTSAKAGPKLLAGSHLESQNYAGWLDGPLGVVYALEAARVLNPASSVEWRGGSRLMVRRGRPFRLLPRQPLLRGLVTEADIDAARDRNADRSMREALQSVGLAGRARLGAERGRHIGYFEAHIEQGDRLESSGLKIGIVTLDRRHLAISHQLHRRAEPCRHHADGDPQGRRPGAGEILRRDRRTVFRRSADPARSGPPAASRSIPARPASSPAAPRCCSRSATTIPRSSIGWRTGCAPWPLM